MTGWLEHGAAVAGAVLPVDPEPPPEVPEETLEGILRRVGVSMGVDWDTLKGPSRLKHVCKARALAADEAHNAGYSTPAIGAALGGRHHSTILHAIASLKPYYG